MDQGLGNDWKAAEQKDPWVCKVPGTDGLGRWCESQAGLTVGMNP